MPPRAGLARLPFLALNRVVNPGLRALLRSPLHGLASGRYVLITYTGRRTGREYTIPTRRDALVRIRF